MSESEQAPCDGACSDCSCGIPEYLSRNLAFTPLKGNSHMWKCQTWSQDPGKRGRPLTWMDLMAHGMIPRHFNVTFTLRNP